MPLKTATSIIATIANPNAPIIDVASQAVAAMTAMVLVGDGCAVGVSGIMVGVAVAVGVLVAVSVGVDVGVSDGASVGVAVAVLVGRGVRVSVRVELGEGVAGMFNIMESLAVAVRPFASRYFTYTVCVPGLDAHVHFTCAAYGCHGLPAKSAELEICTCVG